MDNIKIPILENGTTTLATAGKYCDRNVDVVVDVAGGGDDLPEEIFKFSGNCDYLNSNGIWDWFFNKYYSRITFNNISSVTGWMRNSKIKDFSFDVSILDGNTDVTHMFYGMSELEAVSGKITVGRSGAYLSNMFSGCKKLRHIPLSTLPLFQMHNKTKSLSALFNDCQSLITIPQEIIPHICGSSYTSTFYNCYVLDKIVGLPVCTNTLSSNVFSSTFSNAGRLSRLTFALDNDVPYVVNWKNQTLDLASVPQVGIVGSDNYITKNNSGLSLATKVTDDASYQALKDNPNWWSGTRAYSRYNHDSAVETIHSLPDASAYLATVGGTNTIRLKGDCGASTDGGAINTLTADEIAVATARGWTVTLT